MYRQRGRAAVTFRVLLATVAALAPLALRSPAAQAAPSAPAALTLSWPRSAWVDVPVASVWNHSATARPLDSRVLGPDPDTAAWLAGQTVAERLQLDDLLATQVIMYDHLVVIGHRGDWDLVVIPGQKGRVFPFGVGGWVPADQLTFTAPPKAAWATVAVRSLEAAGRVLSYGTPVPVVASTGRMVTVALPWGRAIEPAAALRRKALAPSGTAVVREAQRFVGLQYLWAGTSSFGYDCSGLTYRVYAQFGIELPRDAADQAAAGRPVGRAALQPGDLLFFSFGGPIEHVGIYAGHGMIIDSPQTGSAVEVVPLWQSAIAGDFAGARRVIY